MDEAARCSRVAYLYMSRLLVEAEPEDLVQLPAVTPPGLRRIEADCSRDVAGMIGHARRLRYVQDLTIFGNTLHLLIEESTDDERVRHDLEASSGQTVAVRPIVASLEDVFVGLTRAQDRGREAKS